MASMFIRHRVADYARWKAAVDEHQATRVKAGFTGHSLHRDALDPNVIIIALRSTDVTRAQQFAASADLRAAMEQAGVQGQPEIWFGEDLEDKRY
jgi:hypothetical protein